MAVKLEGVESSDFLRSNPPVPLLSTISRSMLVMSWLASYRKFCWWYVRISARSPELKAASHATNCRPAGVSSAEAFAIDASVRDVPFAPFDPPVVDAEPFTLHAMAPTGTIPHSANKKKDVRSDTAQFHAPQT